MNLDNNILGVITKSFYTIFTIEMIGNEMGHLLKVWSGKDFW